jgi:hypothetical protein
MKIAICNYKKCRKEFKLYLTKNGRYSKKCKICMEKSRKNERERKPRNRKEKTMNLNQMRKCHKCESEYKVFKTKSGKPSRKCNKCYEIFCNGQIKNTSCFNDLCNICKVKTTDMKIYGLVNYNICNICYQNNNEKICKRMRKGCERIFEPYIFDNGEISKTCRNCREKENEIKRISRSKKPPGQYYKKYQKSNINCVLSTYKSSSKKRNINWGLTDEYSKLLLQNNCFYCGNFPEENYNGIDRINNNKGYILGNVVSCCSMCNFMKCNLDKKDFINICTHIHKYQDIPNEKYNFSECFSDKKMKTSYKTFILSSENRNKKIDISKEQYYKIINMDCYLCGKNNTPTHENYIDRVDNNIGYEILNILSCCKTCNKMKKDYILKDFLNHCSKIHRFNRIEII